MTAFVLVHSPLVGPAVWSLVADHLRSRGHEPVVPSLVDSLEAGPPYWEHQARTVADAVSDAGPDGNLVLAAHSGAGPLLPAIGSALGVAGRRPAAYLFVDAGLPHPEISRLDDMHPSFRARLRALARGDQLPSWDRWWDTDTLRLVLPEENVRARFEAELRDLPLDLFEERLPPSPDWPDAPCGYLRLSAAYEGEQRDAVRQGWAVSHLNATHLAPLVQPVQVADALVSLTRRLVG